MTVRTATAFMHPGLVFAALSLVLLPLVWTLSLWAYASAMLPAAMFLVIAGTAGAGLIRHYAHPTLGACNIITLLRAAFVCVLAGAILTPPTTPMAHWSICAAAVLALSLDGMDGWLARRTGHVSAFGARFDMETDALLGAVLAVIAWQSGVAAIVLLLGFMRYLFVGAAWIWPWLSAPLPDRLRRKSVCVVQIAALIFLLVPDVPQALSTLIVYSATGVLAWSFGADIWLLWQRRA
ncbi:CDP-alcohol phosphatidyltransferase family protein [Tateyamaria pelophila]|uniref:CDP-alcohol phosphatidyltransferase family protein n=1 Tax=Tateyamaria pelophila TaxID=328415 RepID=UPI001CBDD0CB|nr:CDP-alcohol phosphatidyltransferase family protein [Tateyamaria pelophila]